MWKDHFLQTDYLLFIYCYYGLALPMIHLFSLQIENCELSIFIPNNANTTFHYSGAGVYMYVRVQYVKSVGIDA